MPKNKVEKSLGNVKKNKVFKSLGKKVLDRLSSVELVNNFEWMHLSKSND